MAFIVNKVVAIVFTCKGLPSISTVSEPPEPRLPNKELDMAAPEINRFDKISFLIKTVNHGKKSSSIIRL